MSREWIRETPPRWDEGKSRAFGGLDPKLFGLGSPGIGDTLGDEWWRVEDDGRVLGYGRLDSQWGDAEILVAVDPDSQRSGIGAYILDRLQAEADSRRLNYIYNVVPPEHPDAAAVTSWLQKQGFSENADGELRKRVPRPPR